MKLVRELGRRGFLGMTASFALGRGAAPQGRVVQPSLDAVRVLAGGSHTDVTPLDARVVRAVRDSLTSDIRSRGTTPLGACVHHRLDCLFPDRVAAAALPPRWVWVWVEDHWEMFCFDAYAFEVRLAPRLTVLIEVDETTLMG
jgi:hypothetical protein